LSENDPTTDLLSNEVLRTLLTVAERASQIVLEIYEGQFDVEMKAPDDPITEADRRANEFICNALRDAFPGCPVVAEESDPTLYKDYYRAERVFFVDPVDGTREFVKRSGEFVVMLGCVEDTRVSSGVVWAPTDGTRWAGVVGVGAIKGDRQGRYVPIHPGNLDTLAQGRIFVSRAQSEEENARIRTALGGPTIVPMGSAGLKGAAVADGSADAYVAPRYAGKRWDACAPEAIVTASGGVFTDALGEPIDYRSRDLRNRHGLIGASPRLHAGIIERLNRNVVNR
jgi:3'(2'), 5'-bisphosphate nucleotidase